jgi:hypothetical protein
MEKDEPSGFKVFTSKNVEKKYKFIDKEKDK